MDIKEVIKIIKEVKLHGISVITKTCKYTWPQLMQALQTLIAYAQHLKKYEYLTPMGSEFADCPENVYEYIKDRLKSDLEAKKENVLLKRKLAQQEPLQRITGQKIMKAIDEALGYYGIGTKLTTPEIEKIEKFLDNKFGSQKVDEGKILKELTGSYRVAVHNHIKAPQFAIDMEDTELETTLKAIKKSLEEGV